MEKIEVILHYWFGEAKENSLPSPTRTKIWFSGGSEIDAEIKEKFYGDYSKALAGEYADWIRTPYGCLALILLFDQFSRHIYRGMPQAFEADQQALSLCLYGIDKLYDHQLSLIERAFFYFPLMHSESADTQIIGLHGFKMLQDLSFPEAQAIFKQFYEYAKMHHDIIIKFDRFPHRNEILSRTSTPEEMEFLATWENKF